MSTKVVILQPYIPSYRVAFFQHLTQKLARKDIECVIAAGEPSGTQAQRGDAVRPDWLVPVTHKSLNVRGKSINIGVTPNPWVGADAVILGLKGTSAPVYRSLWAKKRTNMAVGLWGHVRPYVSPGNKADLWLERQQMEFADHIFSYTPGGRTYAIDRGVDPRKITVVMNSIDTAGLEEARNSITKQGLSNFQQTLSINPQRTVCYIGGLDETKRIAFLADALDYLWEMDKSIRLLVGGKGPQKHLLTRAFDRGQAVDLGYATTQIKAHAMSTSRCILMPGRIGLIAVDALLMERPVLSTHWPFHAPEVEYLEEGLSLFSTNNNSKDYANSIINFVNGKHIMGRCSYPNIDVMTDNFADGVTRLINTKR